MKYFGSWSTRDECEESWRDDYKTPMQDFPSDEQILFASYGGASYEGDAFVLYEREGKLYEVSGGHCSCFGLEGQWKPEETAWAALAMRKRDGKPYEMFLTDHDNDARAAYWSLVDSRAS